jgi:hypothetical protein
LDVPVAWTPVVALVSFVIVGSPPLDHRSAGIVGHPPPRSHPSERVKASPRGLACQHSRGGRGRLTGWPVHEIVPTSRRPSPGPPTGRKEVPVSIGPVEYLIVAFPGNRFKGEIVPALKEQVDAGTIRIIDLAFVLKDTDGAVVTAEMADLDSEVYKAFDSLSPEQMGLLNEEDLAAAAEELEPNSSAALLVWEDVWATKIRDAIVNAGGEVLDLERIPYEVVQAAVDFAEANK